MCLRMFLNEPLMRDVEQVRDARMREKLNRTWKKCSTLEFCVNKQTNINYLLILISILRLSNSNQHLFIDKFVSDCPNQDAISKEREWGEEGGSWTHKCEGGW